MERVVALKRSYDKVYKENDALKNELSKAEEKMKTLIKDREEALKRVNQVLEKSKTIRDAAKWLDMFEEDVPVPDWNERLTEYM